MDEKPLFPLDEELVEWKEAMVARRKLLDDELQLEPQDSGVVDDRFRHCEGVAVVGMVRGKAVQIRDLVEDLSVPLVQDACQPFLVGIIGVDDGSDPSRPQVIDAFPVVKPVAYLQADALLEIAPDRFKKPIRKKMYVKIDNLPW
jgi:hypothetical protein